MKKSRTFDVQAKIALQFQFDILDLFTNSKLNLLPDKCTPCQQENTADDFFFIDVIIISCNHEVHRIQLICDIRVFIPNLR